MSVVSGQWSVGAKHLEDKLSIIAKNSSPNASPVQLSVVSCQWLMRKFFFLLSSSFFLLPSSFFLIAKRGVSHTPDSEACR
ncbi:hypothetical protein [Dolichospermum sp. UHCC 0315A]|uniref:hypothetical protein n=1 Tax=Dolichospermum sp. UHCC 0315A TaxID=1914871 RepID=UPI00143D9AE8|nr:hypothetical protein [Dolichospermum sp. UHCC 0315A]